MKLTLKIWLVMSFLFLMWIYILSIYFSHQEDKKGQIQKNCDSLLILRKQIKILKIDSIKTHKLYDNLVIDLRRMCNDKIMNSKHKRKPNTKYEKQF